MKSADLSLGKNFKRLKRPTKIRNHTDIKADLFEIFGKWFFCASTTQHSYLNDIWNPACSRGLYPQQDAAYCPLFTVWQSRIASLFSWTRERCCPPQLEIIMKKLLPILILGSALSACASSGGYNSSPYDNRGGYNDDAYVEYQGQRYRKTPAYIECARRDRNNQLLGAGIGAVVGGVVGNEVEGGGTGAAVGAAGGAAAGIAIANKSCGKYLDTRYDDPRYDPYANSPEGYTINGRTYYSERDVETRIRYLEDEDRRLANAPYTPEVRYQRDQIRDELIELRELERRW